MSESLRFEVTLYPAPVLRRVAKPIETFDAELETLVEDMFERMFESKGVGLAAPQVGLKKRLLVVNTSGDRADDLVLVNPVLVDRSGEETVYEEGCLSFPGIFAEVRRPDACTVRAVTAQGEEFERSFTGFTSRVVQHEYDHLEGVLLVDRMSPADKQRHRDALETLVDRYKRQQAKLARG